MIDVQASPVEKVYQDQVNAWRRQRFAEFAYRPGDRLPAAKPGPAGTPRTYLEAFFQTPVEAEHERRSVQLQDEFRRRGDAAYQGTTTVDWGIPALTDIPAFHRQQVVPGGDHCYACDGIGWLLYVRGQAVLAERACPVCGGTGSWRQAEMRSGLPSDAFHPIPPGFHGPPPGGPIPGSTPYLRIQQQRARNVSGTVRASAGSLLFVILFCVAAQLVHFAPGSTTVAYMFALVLGLVLVPISTRAALGPLRDGEVFGPLWLLITPIYVLAGTLSICSTVTQSHLLKTISARTFALAASARTALGQVKLGH